MGKRQGGITSARWGDSRPPLFMVFIFIYKVLMRHGIPMQKKWVSNWNTKLPTSDLILTERMAIHMAALISSNRSLTWSPGRKNRLETKKSLGKNETLWAVIQWTFQTQWTIVSLGGGSISFLFSTLHIQIYSDYSFAALPFGFQIWGFRYLSVSLLNDAQRRRGLVSQESRYHLGFLG